MVGVWLAAASAAEPEWNQLRSTEARASSYLISNWNKYTENYHPSYVLDGNPATAWVEGASGVGIGERLEIPVSRLASARALKVRVRNGYQKSQTLLVANAAPAVLKVEVLREGSVVATDTLTLVRVMGWQEQVVQLPAGRGLDAVRFTLVDAHNGKTYADTCISDVELWVDSDVPYVSRAEEAKHQELLRWIAERQRTAAYFASQPKEYPWAATQFRPEEVGPAPDQAGELAAAAEVFGSLAGAPRYRPTVKGALSPVPDGLWLPIDALLPWIDRSMTLFESEQEWVVAAAPHAAATSTARVLFAADGRTPVRAAFVVHELRDEREVYLADQRYLVDFDSGGRPARVVLWENALFGQRTPGTGTAPFTPPSPDAMATIFTFSWDEQGRIRSIEERNTWTHTRHVPAGS